MLFFQVLFNYILVLLYSYMDVSKNRGTPKWMVKIMENPIKMDDLGVPLFLETPTYIYIYNVDSFLHTIVATLQLMSKMYQTASLGLHPIPINSQ